jgi:hypothetical protein
VGKAADLQKWDNALLARKLLQGKWRTLYFTPGRLNDGSLAYAGDDNKTAFDRPVYCYGGLARTKLNGHVIFGASGGTYGFTTYTATIPDLDLSVTILTNLGRFDISQLTNAILGALAK